ncbi:MAG: metallophosphoesterase [Cyclobacteriaceae bacterium]
MRNCWAILFIFTSIGLHSQGMQITGSVFEDKNGNGKQDRNESGIANVIVSDQVTTTLTDQQGNYTLTSGDDFPYLFISQPEDYVGTYYYAKEQQVNFPLQKTASQNQFRFIHASDTHIDSLNLPRMKRFREMADSLAADFIVASGDLIRDALRVDVETASNYYDMYVLEIDKFKMPVYSGVGNHEIFGIERDKSLVSSEHPLYGKKMFRKYLGPNYYSFNYGGIHFISIDGVDYQNLYYYGGVDSVQLEWLKKDLAAVPSGVPIITFNHIPFMSPGFSFQNFDSHIFYGPTLLEQEGKTEHRHIVYNYDKVKDIIGDRPYPLALSGHYHAAQEGAFEGSGTTFRQTSAITRPDTFDFNGFTVRSGFTIYEVENGQIVSSKFIPLNLPD